MTNQEIDEAFERRAFPRTPMEPILERKAELARALASLKADVDLK